MIKTPNIYAVLVDYRSPYDAEHKTGAWTIHSMHSGLTEAFLSLWRLRTDLETRSSYRKESSSQRTRVVIYNDCSPAFVQEPHLMKEEESDE